MKIYIFLAEGFEEVEALAPADLLRRVGVDAVLVGVGEKTVKGARNISVVCDKTVDELNDLPDGVILPGGNPGFKNLAASLKVRKITEKVNSNGGLVAAICAAPTVLGGFGLLKEKTACCYPDMEDRLFCKKVSYDKVCRDGNIITSRGMGTAAEFGLAIVEYLLGKDTAEKLASQVVFND